MAYTKKTNTTEDVEKVKEEEKKTVSDSEKDTKIEDLQNQLNQLKNMIANLSNNQNNNSHPVVIDTTSKMDKPCTLVHLIECPTDLPTVITVNNVSQHFTKFGETRTFRFADMQNIVSRYRSWFERGIFTLGDDCIDQEDELGIKAIRNPISINTYNKIEQLSDTEFEALIKKINDVQRVHLAQTWACRYQQNKDGYNDINKIRILNKYTRDKTVFKKGILAGLFKDMADEED